MTTDTKTFVEQLLQSRQSEIESAKQLQIEARKENKNLLTQSIREFLGEFWPIVQEHGQAEWSFDASYIPSVVIEIPALDDLQLAPIAIRAHGKKVSQDYYKPIFHSYGSSFNTLVETLAHARESYPSHKDHVKEERIKKAKNDLWHNQQKEEVAVAAHQLLIEIDPDHKEEWDTLLNEWTSYRERMKVQREEQRVYEVEQQERQQIYKQHRQEHIRLLIGWLKDKNLIYQANQILADSIRERFSQPYHEYKLTYGIVAQDDDGDKFVDTNHVWVLDPVPDSNGYWKVNGQEKLFYHLVSIERFDRAPADGHLARRIVRGGVTLHFSPLMSEDTIERAVSQLIEYPQQPKYTGEILDQYEANHHLLQTALHLMSEEGQSEDNSEI